MIVPVPWAKETSPEPQSFTRSGHAAPSRGWSPPPYSAARKTFVNQFSESSGGDKKQTSPKQANKKHFGADGKGRENFGAGKGEERKLTARELVQLELGREEIKRMTRYNNDEDFRRAWDEHGPQKYAAAKMAGSVEGAEGKGKKKVIAFTISDGEDEDEDEDEEMGGL